MHDLLKAFEKEGILTAGMCFQQEEERCRTQAVAVPIPSTATVGIVLVDPLDTLAQKDITDVTVDDLISALHVTPEEVSLLQTMTARQRHNPLWMDVRQWRVTASNIG